MAGNPMRHTTGEAGDSSRHFHRVTRGFPATMILFYSSTPSAHIACIRSYHIQS
jgi:hypothetical protein